MQSAKALDALGGCEQAHHPDVARATLRTTFRPRSDLRAVRWFFDLRLVNFLLALPALQWCSDKQLLREAARGILPDAVRLRRKSPLLRDPLIALLERQESAWVDSFEASPELGRYVERRLIPKVFEEKDAWAAWIHLRPLSLNFWLQSQAATG